MQCRYKDYRVQSIIYLHNFKIKWEGKVININSISKILFMKCQKLWSVIRE